MPAFTQRDYLFFAWNAAVGIACAAMMLRYPALEATLPSFLWLLIGMGLFEAAALGLARGAPPLNNVTRFLGLALSLALFIVVQSAMKAG